MIWYPKDMPLDYVSMPSRLYHYCERNNLETVGEMEAFFLRNRRIGKTKAARNAYPPGCGPVIYSEYSRVSNGLGPAASIEDKVDRLKNIVHYLCDRVADPAPCVPAMKDQTA